jgi:hypothetical protein
VHAELVNLRRAWRDAAQTGKLRSEYHHCNAVQRPIAWVSAQMCTGFSSGWITSELLVVGLGPLADAKDADVPLSTAVFSSGLVL